VGLVEASAWRTERLPGRALESLSAAVDSRPLDPRPYLPWCEILLESKDPAQGLEICARWAEVEIGKGPLLWKARFLIEGGRAPEAAGLLKEVLARDPENAVAWKELVRVHDLAQDPLGASAACRAWAQWRPLDREAWETWLKHSSAGSLERSSIQTVMGLLRRD
jgi:predicted Zn-dependent protease